MFNEVARNMVVYECNIFVLLGFICLTFVISSAKEPVYYVSTEHINITFVNPEYFSFFKATAARPGRWDPKYYVHFHLRSLQSLDNNIKVYYVSTEHINITFVNPEYFSFFNATAARPGRWDPKYYVHFHVRTLQSFDNNIKMDILFYEFRSNEYRRGFVEMHKGFCDFVLKDNFFGPALRSTLPGCPLPAGEYRMTNMSIPDLPLLRTFPFRKGRIYVTGSVASGARVVDGYIDMEIKIKSEARQNKSKGASKT